MTWDDHDKICKLKKKLEEGGTLTKAEMLEVLLILMQDYWERGLD